MSAPPPPAAQVPGPTAAPPGDTATLWDALARAGRGPRGVVLTGQREGDLRLPWSALREDAAAAAATLWDLGLRPGDRLLLALPTSRAWLVAFLACARLGAAPCPVSPPQGFGAKAAFARRLAEVARLLDARAALVEPEHAAAVAAGLAPSTPTWTPDDLRPGAAVALPAPPDAAAPAFVQLTSGTTGRSKGVVVSHRAVLANVAQLGDATAIGPASTIVAWLPLFHDMGLVGCLLTALARDAELVLGTPFGFLRRPRSWLEQLARFGGTHAPAPTFAYRALVERVPPDELAGLDLRRWAVAFVGAEPIPPAVLEAVAAHLAPAGLRPDALLPCYGLAEASLAVTFRAPGRWRRRDVSRRALAASGRLAAPEGPGDALGLTSCGRALPGTTVRILDEDGRERPPGRQGRIVVAGPSLMDGYHGEPPRAGDLDTGDLGALDEETGELFVTGREKDLLIVCGHNHHPSELEWPAAAVPGVRDGKVAAVGLFDPALGTERVALAVEVDRRAGLAPEDVAVAVRRAVFDATGLTVAEVVPVAAGALPVTTSGKVQRGQARALVEAALAGSASAGPGGAAP